MRHIQQSGFSLIELIMVIMVFAVAAVPILDQFTQVASSTMVDEDIQTASQLAQERAEGILELRRAQGYAAVTLGTANDVLTGQYAIYSRSVTVAEPSSIGDCSPGATCKSVVVVVNRGLSKSAEISFVLVDY